MTVEDMPEPSARPGEVVIRVEAAGICGSEVEGYLGMMSNRVPPLVMGHEFAGTVTELGEGVDSSWLGKRVAINPVVGCGRCSYCSRGDRNLCPERFLVGVSVPGGFATTVSVPERCLFEMPADMDARLGALVEPLANGVHAIRKGAPDGATSAVVIGTGTIGLGCVAGAIGVSLFYRASNLAEFQAIQMWRIEWLLAATASFVAGILLKRPSDSGE